MRNFRLLSGGMLLAAAAVLAGCGSSDPDGLTTASNDRPDAAMKAASQPVETPAEQPAVTFNQESFVEGPAPEATLTTLTGTKVKLSSLKGKVVLLDFWAPWCGPCKLGLPFTQRLHDTFHTKGLAVLAVSSDPISSVKPFIKNSKYTMPAYLDGGVAAQAFDIEALPTTILIDKTGKVIAKEVGLKPQQEMIDNLKKAGIDVSGFAPKNDPTAEQVSG